MTYLAIPSFHNLRPRDVYQRLGLMLASTSALMWQLGGPALAGDPFRPTDPRNISDTSEQMFYAMFRDGNYTEARLYLEDADASATDDPMFHALSAVFYYLDGDWNTVEAKAQLTQSAAAAIATSDPLRSNLYEAVGIFLEGAYIIQTQGIARATPTALGMLQEIFDHMDAAAAINPEDPELSLLKGYMDLLLAVNLPFADPEQAIERLATYGYPDYVAYRGIALGYRNLDRNAEALEAIDRALEGAASNPDLLYLKAQILRRLGRNQESIDFFAQALEYAEQLPPATAQQIAVEQCRVSGESRSICKQRARETYGG